MLARLIIGIPIAALITVFLFIAMKGLIEPRDDIGVITITDVDPITYEPPEPRPIKRNPDDSETEPPDLTEVPEGPDRVIDDIIDVVPNPDPSAGDLPGSGPRGDGPTIKFPSIGGPVVEFPPAYPQRCATKGATGTVIVEFDVTPAGEVVDPRIISSADPCFNRTVLNTVVKWKYPPAEGSELRTTQRALTFELEGE
ncbi:MAG: TonB family protein [Pseudomonadota bacterium]